MKKNIVIIVLLIVIAILSVLLYLNTKNTNVVEENKIATEEKIVENTIENTAEVSNTTIDEKETNTTKEEVEELEFTEKEIKECLQNYLYLCGARNGSPSALVEYLFKNAQIDYDDVNGTYIKTNISYKDFKEKMLTYMSEKEFIDFINQGYEKPEFKDINDTLYVANTGASGDYWEVDSIKKVDGNTYNGKTFWIFEEVTREETHFEFTIAESNGKCVIDSCEYVETE